MNLQITKIVCVRIKAGGDHVYLHTTLPQGVWPFEGTASLHLDLARGTSKEYCATNFPNVPYSEIEG